MSLGWDFCLVRSLADFPPSKTSVKLDKMEQKTALVLQCFVLVLKAGKSKIKVPINLVTGEGIFPGFQRAALLLCPHVTVGVGGTGAEREHIL